MILVILAILFIFSLFLPAIWEWKRPKDSGPRKIAKFDIYEECPKCHKPIRPKGIDVDKSKFCKCEE